MSSDAASSLSTGGWLADRFAALWETGGPPPDVFSFLGAHPDATSRDRLGVLLVDQRYRWKTGSGLPVDAYLLAAPEIAAHPEDVIELRRGEIHARREQGETLPEIDALSSSTGHRSSLTPSRIREVENLALTAPTPWSMNARPTESGLTPTEVITSSEEMTRNSHEDVTGADFSIDPELEADTPGDSLELLSQLARFTIQNKLGTGGMGVVYRAHDRDRGEVVALKTMRRVDPRALYRFKQEFRTLADLSHPNLVNLYELVASGDLWYFTMELVEGVDFIAHVRAMIDEPGTRPAPSIGAREPASKAPARLPAGTAPGPEQERRLRHALRQLAEGVVTLHDAGKLHRDIKPTNVLVTRQGRVVLLDFGLSTDLRPSAQNEGNGEPIVGTVAYMAPEQGTGEEVSPACDWYSVGVMLHVALTGKLPFEGNLRDVLALKLRNEPPLPSSLAEGIPADLDALCHDLLLREPIARPKGRAILARLAAYGCDSEEPFGRLPPASIQSSTPPRAIVPASSGERVALLIGRERHCESLRAAFASVRGGQPEMVFVSGRSGSGKSTLLQAFLDEVTARDDAVVLAGRCYERESVPYKALDSVVDALSRHLKSLPTAETRVLLPGDVSLLARVFPVLNRVEAVASAPRPTFEIPDPQELRRRAFSALRTLLARIGREKPLVVAIDDLQWADPENAPLIADLIRPPDPPLLLMLGSFRTEDVATSPFLRSLMGVNPEDSSRISLRFQELSVGALSQGESRALAMALLGRDDPITRAEAHLIARESQGNPFFIDELVKHVQVDNGLAHRLPSAGAITLDEVLWARVARLPDDARRLLGIVAVSSRPIGQHVAFEASDLGGAGRAAVGLLRTGRLVRITGPARRGAIEVYHDRIRETVVSHLSAEVLQELHLRLAQTLEATGQCDPESLAVQFQGAGRLDSAGSYYIRAADRANESLAFAHAARLYRRALDLLGSNSPGAAMLSRKLGDALANAGHGGEAAQAYLEATVGASVAEVLDLKRLATMQWLISGRVDEGLAALRSVLGALGMALPGSPQSSLARLIVRRVWLKLRGFGFRRRDTSQLSPELLTRIDLCWSAATGLSIIDPICGAELQARGLLLALRAGEPYRVARALALEAMHVSTAGGRSRREVERLLSSSQALAEEVGHPHCLGLVPLSHATAALMLGRWRASREAFDRAEAIFRDRCTGVAWELDTVHNLALWATTHMGDLAELRRRCPVLLQEAQTRGDLYAVTTLNTHHMTLLRLADDDPEGARRELDAVMGRWSHRGFHVQHSTAFRAHVHIDLYRGDGRAARARVLEQWPSYRRSLLLRVQMIRIEFLELRGRVALAAALDTQWTGPLLRSAAGDAKRLDREREPWANAHAQLLRAGIAAARFDRNRAIVHLEAATALFEAVEMPLHAAAARRRLGTLLGGPPGSQLIAQADRWMQEQTIRDPARITTVYAPGFPTTGDQSEEFQTMSIS